MRTKSSTATGLRRGLLDMKLRAPPVAPMARAQGSGRACMEEDGFVAVRIAEVTAVEGRAAFAWRTLVAAAQLQCLGMKLVDVFPGAREQCHHVAVPL